MLKRFKNGHLLDISPDGSRVCLYFGNSSWSFTKGPAVLRSTGGSGDYSIQVFETVSWASTYSLPIEQRPFNATFSVDGGFLYTDLSGAKRTQGYESPSLAIDLKSQSVTKHLRNDVPGEVSTFHLSGLRNGSLLALELNRGRRHALLIAGADRFNEEARVDISPQESLGYLADVSVSADRTATAYAVDHSIFCRRTDDLGVIWQRAVEPRFRISKVTISASGRFVAAAAVNTNEVDAQQGCYVDILDGADGSLLHRLSVNGDAGIAISDSSLLAVSQRKLGVEPQRIKPSVRVYDVSSGEALATLEHSEISTRWGYIWGILQSRFTPDGKRLITSGDDETRVWDLGV